MLTKNEAPWIEYLEIDEETRERKLRSDTPPEIRDQYEKYLLDQKKKASVLQPK